MHASHRWRRVARRMGAIAPHRQLQILCAASLVSVGVIVAGVFFTLVPTHASLDGSNRGLVPPVEALDQSHAAYSKTSDAFQLVVNPSPTVRAAGLNRLAQLTSTAEAGWNAFERRSSHLPGEKALRRDFVSDREAATRVGSVFITEKNPSAVELSDVTVATDRLTRDLSRIRELYQTRVQNVLRDAAADVRATEVRIRLLSGVVLVLLLVAFGVAIRSAVTREERVTRLDRSMREDAERNELEARVQRALEMVPDEGASYVLVERALANAAPDNPSELLLADSSRAHFRQVVSSDEHGGPGCPVMSPKECPATTRSQTLIWDSSRALDACPHLRDRPTGDCSAACVPMTVGGNTIGVVHTTAPDGEPPDESVLAKLELITRRAGERIGMLRAFLRSQTQAHTDPLTGLMNRRSLEEEVREISGDARSYVATYGDLDHFKQLNDVYGHDAGDQALRLFARVLRDSVRPGDLVARYGGEEFVVILPDCTVPDARAVVERVRERLSAALEGAAVPRFTVSFGLTVSRPEQTFSETLEVADAALLDAKATGRDRVVVAGTETGPSEADALRTESSELMPHLQ